MPAFRILLVDDDPPLLEVMAEILAAAGYAARIRLA